MNGGPLIDLLLEEGLVSDATLSVIEPIAAENGRIVDALVEHAIVDETILAQRIARRLGLELVDLGRRALPTHLEREVPIEIAEPHQILPLAATPKTLSVAMSDPFDDAGREWVARSTGRSLAIAVGTATGVRHAIRALYGRAAPPAWALSETHRDTYRTAVRTWGDHGANRLFSLAGEKGEPTSSGVALIANVFVVRIAYAGGLIPGVVDPRTRRLLPETTQYIGGYVHGVVDGGEPFILDGAFDGVVRLLRLGRVPLHRVDQVVGAIRAVSWCAPFDEATAKTSASWHGLGAPPAFDGRELQICYEDRSEGAIYRARIDARTFEATLERLGRARVRPIRGRPYVDERGAIELPSLVIDDGARHAIADEWREVAAVEYASVASFARASLELMSAGAPPDLVRRAHEAATDEVTHAELAYRVAERIDGRSARPGPIAALPPRSSDPADIALYAFREGSIAEAIAVREAEVALEGATDPEVRAFLETIIADEERHRALADEIVHWAIGTGGRRVRAALRSAIAALELAPSKEPAPPDDDRTSLGLLDGGSLTAIAAGVTREVADRWTAELGRGRFLAQVRPP
jgi:hypothetical protein